MALRSPGWGGARVEGRGGRAGVRAGSERRKRRAGRERRTLRELLHRGSDCGGEPRPREWGTLPGPAASSGRGSSGLLGPPQCPTPALRFPGAARLRLGPAVSRPAAACPFPGLSAQMAALCRRRCSVLKPVFLNSPIISPALWVVSVFRLGMWLSPLPGKGRKGRQVAGGIQRR